jgi:hypothetical protein
VTLGSKCRRTHNHILLSCLRLPQPGQPGPRICIPQENGGPVFTPVLPFHSLLGLAGLQWSYSNPPTHWQDPNGTSGYFSGGKTADPEVNHSLPQNICSFVHQCNTFTSYILLIVDIFRPHTAIFRCYSILSRSCTQLLERTKNKYSVLNERDRMLKYNTLSSI